jgi:hypothetical protein
MKKGEGMISYVGVVKAGEGLLLGGVKVAKSVRFEDKRDALDWVDTTESVNRKANRDVVYARVETSGYPFEVKKMERR